MIGSKYAIKSDEQDWSEREHDHGHEFPGCDIEPDAVEFGRAMEQWQRRHGRWPKAADVLKVAKSIGYEKIP